MLADGIASAKKTGNSHAQAEMEGMLAELGSMSADNPVQLKHRRRDILTIAHSTKPGNN